MKKAAFLLFAAAALTGSAHGFGRNDSCCAPACPPPSCDPCCQKPGLLDRLRGLFHKNDCCEPKCEVHCAPKCPPPCDTGCGHQRRKLFHRDDCCAPTCAPACKPACAPTCAPACKPACQPSCDPCCDRPGLLERLRARFHRNDCCDPCCTDGGVTSKGGETIKTVPKKLPGGEGGKTGIEAPTGEVRIITPPVAPVAPPAITIPAAPGLDSRSPF